MFVTRQNAGRYMAKFANLRAYYGYMWGYPGKKLLFMGNEFAQGRESELEESLDGSCLTKTMVAYGIKAYCN